MGLELHVYQSSDKAAPNFVKNFASARRRKKRSHPIFSLTHTIPHHHIPPTLAVSRRRRRRRRCCPLTPTLLLFRASHNPPPMSCLKPCVQNMNQPRVCDAMRCDAMRCDAMQCDTSVKLRRLSSKQIERRMKEWSKLKELSE